MAFGRCLVPPGTVRRTRSDSALHGVDHLYTPLAAEDGIVLTALAHFDSESPTLRARHSPVATIGVRCSRQEKGGQPLALAALTLQGLRGNIIRAEMRLPKR